MTIPERCESERESFELKDDMIKKTIFIAWICLMVFCTSQAYEQRNLLQNHATEALIRRSLVMQQQWVPFPKYADRAGWGTLFGGEKQAQKAVFLVLKTEFWWQENYGFGIK